MKFFLIIIFLITIKTKVVYSQKLSRPIEINSRINKENTQDLVKNNQQKHIDSNSTKDKKYYQEFIKALNIKKEYLQKDSLLNIKAIKLDWYKRINKEIEQAEKQLLKLKYYEK